MIPSTDKSLWRACMKGNNKAFEKLYKHYYPLLYNYGRKFSADEDLIRDCIQNLFVKLIQNHQSISDTSSVKGYLLKAYRNHLYDALRSQVTHDEMFQPGIDDILLFETDTASHTSEMQDNILVMQEAYKELSPRQQEILYLYYIHGVSHSDISTALNINYQSSKNLLSRSLSKLKDVFCQKMKISENRNSVK